ncbi:MAG: hypothetical protein ABR881_31990 [Candidatus Sulfotelmatobacter sp.]
MVLFLALALLLAGQQNGGSADSATNMQQRAHEEYERHRQAAIRINDLAAQVQSEADAEAIVEEIAALFSKEMPSAWLASGINQRVAKAEYQSARGPANRIPEQRIVDVWNQYVREIGAPEEALVTTAEIHNMRDAERTVAQHLWARGYQTIWTMPNVFALGPDGKVADGCRAIEAIRVIYDLDRFQNLRSARDRARRGVLASEQVKNRVAGSTQQVKGSLLLAAHADDNPVRSAERRCVQEHGSLSYDQLLKHSFDELFPPE